MTARVGHVQIRHGLARLRACDRQRAREQQVPDCDDLAWLDPLLAGLAVVLTAFVIGVLYLAFNGEGRDPVKEAPAAITTGAVMENDTQQGGQGGQTDQQQNDQQRQQQDTQQGGQQKD